MTITTYVVKYSVAGSTGVVGQQVYTSPAKFEELYDWVLKDTLNRVRDFVFTTRNDEYSRANAMIERNVHVPFLRPYKGIVTGKIQDNNSITITTSEFPFHLTRRIYKVLNDAVITYVPADRWYDLSWKFRRRIRINGDYLNDAVSDIPVQFHNKHDVSDPFVMVSARADGNDFLVTGPDGITKIPHEIERWDSTTGEAIIRFKLPKLKDSTGTAAYVYFGNSNATNQSDITNVWTNNFAAVYHLEENPVAGAYKDSVTNTLIGIPFNMTRISGHHGYGGDFNGTNGRINCGSANIIDNIFDPDDVVFNTSTVHGGMIECWIKPDSAGAGGYIINKSPWAVYVNDLSAGYLRLSFSYAFSTTPGQWQTTDRVIPVNSQTKISLVYNNGATTNIPVIYVNGRSVNITTVVSPVGTRNSDAANDLIIGNNTIATAGFDGLIDEVRIHTDVKSAVWNLIDFRNETMDTNERPYFMLIDPIEIREDTAANIAQDILNFANEDMPAGVTWILGEDFPTDTTTVTFQYDNHFDALQALALSIGKDCWMDSHQYKVYIGTKGKTIDDELDLVITSDPIVSIDNFANSLNIIGKTSEDAPPLQTTLTTSTVLRYNYEKVISDSAIGTENQLTGVGNALISEFQKLTPRIRGTIPYNQVVRWNLESGDIITVNQPEKQVQGQFRITEIITTPLNGKLVLESTATGIIRTRANSLSDIIEGLIKQQKKQSI